MTASAVMFLATVTLTLSGCGGGGTPISFNPDFHRGVHDAQPDPVIQGEGNRIVSTRQPAFDEYACMHKTKVVQLLDILSRAQIPSNFYEFKDSVRTVLDQMSETDYQTMMASARQSSRQAKLLRWIWMGAPEAVRKWETGRWND